MKRIFIVICLSIFFPLFCFSENKINFSISQNISLSFTQLDEILYISDGTECSHLIWNQKPLLDFGLASSLEINNFSIAIGFDYSIPLGKSNMTDSDWIDGEKYSYTIHPIEKSKKINAFSSIKCNIKVVDFLSIEPIIEIDYIFNDIKAGNGTGKRNNRNIKVYGIDYTRHSFFFFTGLGFDFRLPRDIYVYSDFILSPYCYQYSYNYHHGVNHPFSAEEKQKGNFSKYKATILLGKKINHTLSLVLFSNYIFGTIDKGLFYTDYYSDNISYISDQKSGSSIYSINIGISTNFAI